jgi:hypothetical protein
LILHNFPIYREFLIIRIVSLKQAYDVSLNGLNVLLIEAHLIFAQIVEDGLPDGFLNGPGIVFERSFSQPLINVFNDPFDDVIPGLLFDVDPLALTSSVVGPGHLVGSLSLAM